MDGCVCVRTTVSAPMTRSGPSSGFSVYPSIMLATLSGKNGMIKKSAYDESLVNLYCLVCCGGYGILMDVFEVVWVQIFFKLGGYSLWYQTLW